MEATEPELNGSGHRVIKQSYNSDEACLHDVDNFHLLHPEVSQEEGLIKHNDSSSSSEASHENMIEVVTGIESGSVLLEHGTPSELIDDRSAEEDKDESPDSGIEMPSPDYTDATHSTSPFDIPTIQVMERNEHYDPDRIPESVFASNETMTSREWSATSNESLFSIHPETISYGGDQPLLLPSEMHKEKEMQESDESPFMRIGKERRLEASQDKIHGLGQDEAKPPNATLIPSNPSPRSDGSEGSDYSFAFPILVANTVRSSSNRGDGWRPARGHHLGAQRSSARQGPASPHKRGRCSSCFSCPCNPQTCFSCCNFNPSCKRCAHLSCFSCCNPQTCFSCCNFRPSCKRCAHLSCFSCPCNRQTCFSCCNFRPSCKRCAHLSCFSCCNPQTCFSCCNFRPSCKRCSCWPCR